jgi:4-hydroxybenzoate polyprenyltransferase
VPDEAVERRASEDASDERGRRQAVAVGVSVVGAVLLLAALGATPLSALMMQLLLFGLLFMQLFRGRAWARWTLVALTGFGALAYGAAAAGAMGPEHPRWLSIGFAVVFGWSALVLALSRHVRRFAELARTRNS